MKSIKSFIYLDDYKMYSISSQIFEGMTEYIIKSTSQKTSEKNEQKGELFSGRILADIIDKQSDESEKKFLHDYSYTLFEKYLIDANKVLIIDKEINEERLQEIQAFNFIKITSRIAFNDTKQIEEVMGSFNELGTALTRITNKSLFDKTAEVLDNTKAIKDRNQKNKVEQTVKNALTSVTKLAKENGLYLEPDYIESLKTVLNYGYNGQFEIQMPLTINEKHFLFSALLDRTKLKEDERNIIKKHGRLSERNFTIFGILTQVQNEKQKLELYRDRSTDENTTIGMKEAIMNMIFHLTNVESTFSGKLDYEFVIDPIAIYQEL